MTNFCAGLQDILISVISLCCSNSIATTDDTNIATTNGTNRPKRSCSNLPPELLQLIADRLGLIELLCFRGVCKDWRAASSTFSASVESEPHTEPSFLLQTNNGEWLFYYRRQEKNYTIDIPELKRATFLASNQGWLLVFQEGSLFFFCPFSRARIDLPKFPHSEISDRIAAFSAPPTSSDCIVSVIHRSDKSNLEINLLHRGADTWTKHAIPCDEDKLGPVTGATYSVGTFDYVDNFGRALNFSISNESWYNYAIVKSGGTRSRPFWRSIKCLGTNDVRKWMGVDEDVSISASGAVLPYGDGIHKIICKDNIEATKGSGGHELNGVWIQPRLHHISPNQTW